MYKFLSTTAFSILVATSWFFALLSALPIFVQFVLVHDVNLRIWDVVLGGFPYLVTGVAFFVSWVQRRYMLFYRLDRIPRHSIIFKQDDAPNQVIELIQTEYLRVSAISHFSRPTTGSQPGWGVPGTKYDGIYFKRAFLDAVERLDATARELLPSLAPLSFATRPTNHFRPLLLIIPTSSDALRDMDAAMQIATFAVDDETSPSDLPEEVSPPQWPLLGESFGKKKQRKAEKGTGEMTEAEFERGMNAVAELQEVFDQEKEYLGSEISSLSDHGRSSANNSRIQLRSNGDYDDDEKEDSMRRRAQSGFYRRGGSERQTGFRLEVQEPMDERNDTVFHLPS